MPFFKKIVFLLIFLLQYYYNIITILLQYYYNMIII